jgi:hypothetical protein
MMSIIDYIKIKYQRREIHLHSIEEWVKILSEGLSMKYSTIPYSINPGFLYRARSNWDNNNKSVIDIFTNSDDLWAPLPNNIHKQGRCNNIGQSLLYCCVHDPTITLFELSPEENTEMTVMEYEVKGNIGPLGVLGIKEISLLGDDFKKIFGNHFDKLPQASNELDDFLSSVFNIRDNEIYNLTNAITRIFLSDQKADIIPNFIKPPKSIGFGYKSVASDIGGMNIALEPDEVKDVLIPNIAYKCKIIKRYDQHCYSIQWTHQTNKIENGKLFWESKVREVEHITDILIPVTRS